MAGAEYASTNIKAGIESGRSFLTGKNNRFRTGL
jgi:hypothetical protein